MVGGTQHFATALRKSNSPGKHMMIKDILCWGIRFQFSRLLFQRLGSVMNFLPRIFYPEYLTNGLLHEWGWHQDFAATYVGNVLWVGS
jgi:hypothetical protein